MVRNFFGSYCKCEISISWGGNTKAYGVVTAPNHKGIPADIMVGKPWAGDLGCLMGPDFVKKIDFNRVVDWLPLMRPHATKCLFLAGGGYCI